jgi:6-phosphofructokinase 1
MVFDREVVKMTKAPKANAVVGQSGGPTAVINASLVGVIEEAKRHPEIKKLYGAVHAVAGIARDHFIDLKKLSAGVLKTVAATPSSALGSSRDKPTPQSCAEILEVFRKRDVRYFFYIGGNDSANTARILKTVADQSGYELHTFHVPKTVDNDLLVTDHCPGYGTAATFVAMALMGDDLDNRALPGVKIDVIMGRNAGFLTAASALGRKKDNDGPHLIYIPERSISLDKFLSDVDSVVKRIGRCVVAVSEGIRDTDGITWAEKLAKGVETDAHGNIQLSGTGALADFLAGEVKDKLKIKRVRADTFGYLQRSFLGLRSAVDVSEARRCGKEAVRLAMNNDSGSVAIKRISNKPRYAAELFRTELSNVAEKTKTMPDEFISAEDNGVTDAFIEYAMPLIGRLPRTEYLGNYPRA